ncbi:MAG: hypothetical protein SCALA701_23410 [Candidatus Scalindua sp.]|nr:MAG: hypothetical protein SCALA701_23410 [Candidatus Scalindua sp.]
MYQFFAETTNDKYNVSLGCICRTDNGQDLREVAIGYVVGCDINLLPFFQGSGKNLNG